jgi:hypothetical protein
MQPTSNVARARARVAASAVIAALVVSITAWPAAAASAPTISSFDPSSGPVGTSVAIHGTNFTGTTSVAFNGVNAPGFSVNATGQRITVDVPSGSSTGPIVVMTPEGSAQSGTNFIVTTGSAPTITSFNPAGGDVGSTVVIHGALFTGVNAVRFNGTAAAFTFVTDVKVTAVVPNGATTGRITLSTPSGTATSATNFSVTGAAPTITSFDPAMGPVGTVVTIHGTHFTDVNAVTFKGTAAAFTFVTAAKVTAVVPNGATTGRIKLSTPSGTATSPTNFTVTGPKITGFNPDNGGPGTLVTINGASFGGTSAVRFNGIPATFTLVSARQVKAVVPSGATTGPITVTTPAGTATSPQPFIVLAAHPRRVSLSIGGRPTRATGQVLVLDGYDACRSFVPVVIKRFRGGRWRWITTTSTGKQGHFRAFIPDRSGRYRAKVLKIQLANGATCKGDLSNVVRHHRRVP